MTRTQAQVLSMISAFMVLGLVAIIVALLFPYEQVFSPTPTPTFTSIPVLTLTPTSQSFLPTPNPVTPTVGEPTATNTRVPTASPAAPSAPTPTVLIELPTPYVRPTATPVPPLPVPTNTAEPTPTRIPSRQYIIVFKAQDDTVSNGDCTILEWRVDGPVFAWLDNRPINRAGSQEICPKRDTTYILKVQVEGIAQIDTYQVEVSVE